MPALFPRWSNTALPAALAIVGSGVLAVPLALMIYVRTPWNTEQFQPIDQPVEFDHRHHVADDQIDCLYCHSGAEVSRSAGIPASDVCMGCHSQVFNESPLLEKLRRSYFSGQPLPWNRVHDVGDFVYFDHAVHVARGVGCISCHGAVDHMSRVEKVTPLSMQWCLDCHRAAERATLAASDFGANGLERASQRSEPFSAARGTDESSDAYDPMRGTAFEVSVINEIGARGQVTSLTTCSACHR